MDLGKWLCSCSASDFITDAPAYKLTIHRATVIKYFYGIFPPQFYWNVIDYSLKYWFDCIISFYKIFCALYLVNTI